MRWVTNTSGKPDAMLTMTIWSFVFSAVFCVAIVALLATGLFTVEDVEAIAGMFLAVGSPALLGSTGGYVMRRNGVLGRSDVVDREYQRGVQP